MRLLDRPRPDVDVALLVEAAVEGECFLLGPGFHDEVMRLEIFFAQHRGVLAIGVASVHRRPDRETGDEASARDAVDHRELFGDAGRRIVEREAVPHHANRGVGGAPRERGCNQVRRGHQAVAVRVVLVAADGVEAALSRVLHLVHEIVVHVVGAFRVEQLRMDVDPDRGMLLTEVVGQLRVGHQVEPHQLHGGGVPPSICAHTTNGQPARGVKGQIRPPSSNKSGHLARWAAGGGRLGAACSARPRRRRRPPCRLTARPPDDARSPSSCGQR